MRLQVMQVAEERHQRVAPKDDYGGVLSLLSAANSSPKPTFGQLLALLQESPAEAALAEAGVEYYVVHGVGDDPDFLGVVFVETAEGMAAVPYMSVLPEQGYEQLDPGAADLLDREKAEFYLGEVDYRIRRLEYLRERLKLLVGADH